ncbi:MAG: hypothetical protein JXA25_13555 [Anaerolineales bacterium]|nr:hypothetical protein [Anaerolineales bacterium]
MKLTKKVLYVLLVITAMTAASLACGQTESTPTEAPPDLVATSVSATMTAVAEETEELIPSEEVPPTESPEPTTGTISGRVCYPSEFIPEMTAYFMETTTNVVTELPIAENQGLYSIELPTGTYVAYIWRDEYNLGGSYSQAVPCGLHVGCTDHSLIPIPLVAGAIATDVDLCDWYGDPGDVPLPPGVSLPTATPPPGGISLNCDGTYQRVRITDAGADGKTLWVDNWVSGSWSNVWSLEGGDAMIRQIEDEAGYYNFGTCKKLIIIPLRYSGSGAVLELEIYRWTGSGISNVYSHEGTHGEWSKLGDMITFEESIYLYGEPNCCPCNRQVLEHTWDGAAFVQTGSAINPTYTGDPPDHCVP